MANVTVLQSPFTIDAQNAYLLGGVGPAEKGFVVAHIVSNTFSGTITIKATAHGGQAATPVAVPYASMHLNGSVGTGALVSTAITTTSLIKIDGDGQDAIIDCTAYTSGTATVYFKKVAGY